jgi:TatD DNase family protein
LLGIIDTHAHLSDLEDMDGVIERAKKVGIEAIIGVSANLTTCKRTLELAKAYPGYIYPALGIHPTEWSGDDIASSTRFIEENIDDCLAVGEIGLDYWNRNARKSKDIRERQRELYTFQLKMARKHEKPASVHGRGSWEDALQLAKNHGPDRIVFHWYSGPIDVLSEVLDTGFLISATPASEFSKHHRAALVEAPIERIVIETDSPVSYHGKQAEPADILLTLRALADLKGISEDEAARITTGNAKRFFKI